jgi:hypothetical protein
MIPIIFATIVESMFKQIPQIDFTFGIGDIVGSIALLVSAFTFYISYSQASQSEQIKMSRDLWAGIKEKGEKIDTEELRRLSEIEDKFARRIEVDKVLNPMLDEMNYFAYLILSGEIKDRVVLGYYKSLLTTSIEAVQRSFLPTEGLEVWREWYPHLVRLIKEWKIQTY